MDTKAKEIRSKIRARIKDLEEKQIKTKYARRRISKEEFEKIRKEVGGSEYWCPQYEVFRRRAEITACLNFYHEIRGSKYRHGVRKGWEYIYKKYFEELKATFKV